jgi:hypothetical protein
MKFRYTGLLVILLAALIGGCKNADEEVFKDPYEGGKPGLGIVVNQQQVPVPAEGGAGVEVRIKATGLVKHWDEKTLKFLFNGENATIKSVDADGITAIVPDRASSGVTSFVVGGQVVFGPDFSVLGKVKKDFTYKVVNGTDGAIYRVLGVASGNVLFLGDFTNFDNKGLVKRINRIARTFPDGTYDRSLGSGTGANGPLLDMAIVNSNWYIAGSFSGYAQRDGLSNITKLSSQGQIDTVAADTYEHKTKYVSRFNGGTNGTITNVYPSNGQLIITGDFSYYLSRRYDQPSYQYKDSVVIDTVDVRQLAKLNVDGTLDKTWRFDANAPGYKGQPGRSLPAANGPMKTIMHSDGKILVYGLFTKFDDATFGNIVRLNPDGSIDPTFNAGKPGADDGIAYVSYNAVLNKYLAVGRFKKFNGEAAQYMVLLNYDGSVDQTFKAKVFEGDIPVFCKLLNDGLGVISGQFKTYDGAARNGFLITDLKGDLAVGYNTIGNLQGQLYDVFETKSTDDKRALLLVGRFFLFDNQITNNMVRVTLE